MTADPSTEILRLRATVRDLLALSTIPEVWVGQEPPAIAADLADLLIGSLDLDFAFVRLYDPAKGQIAEATRGNSWKAFPEWLQHHLAEFGQISRKEILTNVGAVEESRRGIVIPIGVNSERGLVAAASDRSDFPNQIDQQLLSVAANNAATAFQNAFLIKELRSAQEALRANEQELRKARDELENKVAERTAELCRSERELRDVLDSIPAIVRSALPDGSNSYLNRRFVEYCGMPPEQIAGSGWHTVTHPEDLERHNAKWLACVASGEPFEDEVRFRRADGEYRWHLQRGVPLRDEAGNIVKWYGVLTDIEGRKRVEAALRRNEHFLAEAQRLSHTGGFGWSASTDEHFWSDETFRIFEFDPSSKVSSQMILERIHPQDKPSVKMALATATRADGIDIECRLLMPDGRIKYLHVVGKAERDGIGTNEVIGAVMDVTARKRTEVELRRSQAHLTDAQRLSRTGSVGMKVSTKQLFWSEEAAHIYGYAPGTEATADLVLQRVHPDDVDLLKSVLERAAQGGSAFDFEHRLLMPDGSIKHLRSLSHSLIDEAGNEEAVGAIMDITEHKVAEEMIRRSEAFLAEAQRLSHTGSFGWKTENGEIVWSDETYRIFEYDRSDKPTLDMVMQRIDPQDRFLAQQVTERVSTTGEDFEHECRLLMPSGAIKHIHVRAHALAHSSSGIEFVGAVSDITGRKEAEERLQQQETELRQMLDLAPQLIGVLGPQSDRLYANRVTLSYYGVTLDEWRQRNNGSEVHPDDVDRIKAHIDRSLTTGAANELEMRLRAGDGTYRWFLVRSNPLRDDQGHLVRWYIACTDIEDRKRAEEKLKQENVALREEIDRASMFEEIVGTSPALQTVLSRISKVAPTDSTVLITGETGTGKELVARAIHRRSNRALRAFVSVNCAAIPRDLIASELFGHEKGAFTGAMQRRIGRFELAEGGTIFLDEVGELLPDTQVALLRVLQEREIERVGGVQSIRVDVRVVAATNRDLKAAVANGTFREDLYYRLNVVPLEIPPLRARRADIPLLVEYFIDRYGRKAGKNIRSVDKETLQLLQSYPWPGNIRELQNIIERSVIVCETEIFTVDESWLSQQAHDGRSGGKLYLSQKLAAKEKEVIEEALRESQGRVFGPSGAAAKLGIARSTLDSKIQSLNINKKRFKPKPRS
jgi:PAS domain S-box-containing protein